MKHIILVLLIVFLIQSCDCRQNVSGKIIDENNNPIENVEIQNIKKKYSNDLTDTNGEFNLTAISGGLACPPMKISISKQGYNTLETSIKNGGYKKIKLKKSTKYHHRQN